jgi:hypothetical protein
MAKNQRRHPQRSGTVPLLPDLIREHALAASAMP